MTEAPPPSPLSLASTWDLVSAAYTEEISPLFQEFVPAALALAELPPQGRLVDVATGPGTLALLAARAGYEVDAVDFAPDMVAQLQARLAQEPALRVSATVGDGQALPFADSSFDGAFSLFGLMFFPDRARGFQELRRVLRPGARAIVTSWTDLGEEPLFGCVFGGLGELLGRPPGPRVLFPLTEPADCMAEMTAGGFEGVQVIGRGVMARYASARALIAHLVRSNAILALTKKGMGEGFLPIEAALVERVRAAFGEGPVAGEMRANVIVGRRPA